MSFQMSAVVRSKSAWFLNICVCTWACSNYTCTLPKYIKNIAIEWVLCKINNCLLWPGLLQHMHLPCWCPVIVLICNKKQMNVLRNAGEYTTQECRSCWEWSLDELVSFIYQNNALWYRTCTELCVGNALNIFGSSSRFAQDLFRPCCLCM